MIEIIPAIDLLGGCAVRLREGRREEATIYSRKPTALIAEFAGAGASRVHVVDLDGAFSGKRKHAGQIAALIDGATLPVQVGGGLRTREAILACLDAGADRVIVGTAAIKAPAMVAEICRQRPGQIIVAVDAVDGFVATEGWVETSEMTALAVAERAAEWGAVAVLYTDVRRDGTEIGPNVEATAELARAMSGRIDVIASGGVGELAHIRALAASGARSAIVGRALYERRFSLGEAIAAASMC